MEEKTAGSLQRMLGPDIRDERMQMNLPPPYRMIHIMERPRGFVLDFHSHKWYHINYLFSGSVQIYFQNRVINAVEGQAFILPPYIPHKLVSEGGYEQLGMDILDMDDQRGIHRLVRSTFGSELSIISIARSQKSFSEMYSAIRNLSVLNTLKLINTAEYLLLEIVENAQAASGMTFKNNFLEMIYRRDPFRITLDEMCEELNLSRTHLERLVKREFGCGAVEYCNKLKLSKICKILQSTDMTIKEIAEQMNFYDESHFNTFFKKNMGLTPGKYRALSRTAHVKDE